MRKLTKLGLSLAALLALGAILSASAWALNPPENSLLPSVSPQPPEPGKTMLANKGLWKNSPISYAYQWERCSLAGTECSAIGGATATEYKVQSVDREHTLAVKVTATNSAGQGVAQSTPKKVLGPPEIFPAPTEKSPVFFQGSGTRYAFEWGQLEACTAEIHGRFVAPSVAKDVTISFTQCNEHTPSFETAVLEGKLGYLNESAKTVGLRLSPETVGSEVWATNFLLSGERLVGSLFGSIGPVGTSTQQFTLNYAGSGKLQEITSFQGASENAQLRRKSCEGGVSACGVGVNASPVLNTSSKIEIR
jgi:hypothetical protein